IEGLIQLIHKVKSDLDRLAYTICFPVGGDSNAIHFTALVEGENKRDICRKKDRCNNCQYCDALPMKVKKCWDSRIPRNSQRVTVKDCLARLFRVIVTTHGIQGENRGLQGLQTTNFESPSSLFSKFDSNAGCAI